MALNGEKNTHNEIVRQPFVARSSFVGVFGNGLAER
jgi:hypothetical protein